MSCDTDVCGTGNGNHPQPGDPDTNVSLSARTVFSGIEVSWSWPVTNGHAVAFTSVFRSTSNDFSTAIEITKAGGSFYFDRLNPSTATTYFYWIQIVSVNGTVGALVGPASAIAQPLATQTLETLTGQIDSGVLAEALKTDISGITLTNAKLYQEIQDRLMADQGFAAAYNDVQSGLTQAMTYINTEITQRQDGDNALVTEVNILAAANQNALAAIDTERQVRVSQNDSMASQITDLYSKVGGNSAAIEQTLETHTTEIQANADAITRLATTVGDSNAGLVHDMSIMSTQLSSVASDVTTVEADVNGDVATGQVGLTATVRDLGNNVTEIGALYTAKVEVNGLVGGFGAYNNGQIVEAGFDVDLFWVGRTGPDKVKPFIVSNGIVYMDKAIIRDADIDTLKIAGEAVTVPLVVTAPDKQRRSAGIDSYDKVTVGYINMTQPGILYVLLTFAQGFSSNSYPACAWAMELRVDGVTKRHIQGGVPNDAPAMSLSMSLDAGVHKIEAWWAAGNAVILGYSELFMLGAKR